MIPVFANTYTSTVSGQVVRAVTCENCTKQYVYVFKAKTIAREVSVYGLDNAGSKQRASDRAQSKFDAEMKTGCYAAPCSHCGWIQRHMFNVARADRNRLA